MSTRKVATKNEVSQSSVCDILEKHKFPYKMLHVQMLVHEDFDRRIEFSELIEARENDFINNIVFFDEANFELHGNVNRQNFRYWSTSTENPHWIGEITNLNILIKSTSGQK